MKIAYTFEKDQAIKNEIEDLESYASNLERFKVAADRHDFDEALSCIGYLVNKIPNNDALKMFKV